MTFNPIVDVVYIPPVSQLDDDIKTLLYYMNYSGDISPVLFNLGATSRYKSHFWAVSYRKAIIDETVSISISSSIQKIKRSNKRLIIE